MRNIFIIVFALLTTVSTVKAEDTLYIYKAGVVINQYSTADMDSLTFFHDPTIIADNEGNLYHTVVIGTQTWMTENLRVSHYNNGDAIPTTTTPTKDITSETQPEYQWAYNGDENNIKQYGRLYTWKVINDSRNICPTGWHEASGDDWGTLEMYLRYNGFTYDGSTVAPTRCAKALAASSGWDATTAVGTPGNTDFPDNQNKSGFTALPGGKRLANGTYTGKGSAGNWWTTSECNLNTPCTKRAQFNNNTLETPGGNYVDALSVRCVKD